MIGLAWKKNIVVQTVDVKVTYIHWKKPDVDAEQAMVNGIV